MGYLNDLNLSQRNYQGYLRVFVLMEWLLPLIVVVYYWSEGQRSLIYREQGCIVEDLVLFKGFQSKVVTFKFIVTILLFPAVKLAVMA